MDSVQIRLMSDDEAAVEAVMALLHRALGERLLVTGHVPTRRGPGLRVYGVVRSPASVPARFVLRARI